MANDAVTGVVDRFRSMPILGSACLIVPAVRLQCLRPSRIDARLPPRIRRTPADHPDDRDPARTIDGIDHRQQLKAYKPGSDGATVAEAGQTLFLALSDLQLGIIKSDHATKTMASAKLPMIMMPVNNTGTCTFKTEACADPLGQAIKALDTAEAEIGVKL